ncbi:MAG: PIN domain-containing protein [Thermoanaerobaculia bacterium]
MDPSAPVRLPGVGPGRARGGAPGGPLRFWDSSAVLALAVRGPASEKIEPFLKRDPEVVLWWGTALECASVLTRQKRLSQTDAGKARAIVEHLRARSFEVQPTEEVRARAARILSVHPLRTAAALQLAAALVWCRERPQGVSFVSLDEDLRLAAAMEGFLVMPYAEEVHEPEAGG